MELTATKAGAAKELQRLEKAAGVEVRNCYQCGKCTAGCPVAFAMDYSPRQIMRLLQLGLYDEAVGAHSPWLCASCITCSTRCPKGVNIAGVMETLRIEAKNQGLVPEKAVGLFDDLFLQSVQQNGRVHEMGLILRFNLKSGKWFKDAAFAPKLWRDGKISPRAEKAGREAVARIFARAHSQEGE